MFVIFDYCGKKLLVVLSRAKNKYILLYNNVNSNKCEIK